MSIGDSIIRVDGEEKVRATTRFCADLDLPGLWHAVVVRSDVPAGTIQGLEIPPGIEELGAVVLTPGDIPGENVISIIEEDMPCLAGHEVRYLGEPLALVAAPTLELARRASRLVQPRIEPEAGLFGIDAIVRGLQAEERELDVLATCAIQAGDVATARERCERVTSGEYVTGPQEQAYLETQVMIGIPRGDTIQCIGSMQCPYYVRPAVARVTNLPPENVVVRQAPTGGAFGGKEDFPSMMACHVALLARTTGNAVRLVLDRPEDMAFTTKRHASWTHLESGVNGRGELQFLQGELILDAGAYTTLSPVVLSRYILHACGAYRCPNVSLRARAIRSNMPPSGAFRGFGAPQAHFAIESHMDDVAREMDISPLQIRRRNILEQGDQTATGQVLDKSVGALPCLEDVTQRSDFETRWSSHGARPSHPGARTRRGVGLATCLHGGGFTGNGERNLRSRAGLTWNEDGTVAIETACTEMGQGLLTTFCQIVAERMQIPMERIRCDLPDTSCVPDSGPTVASRSTMIVGRILERCADALTAQIQRKLGPGFSRQQDGFCGPGGEHLTWEETARTTGTIHVQQEHRVPEDQKWDEQTYRGSAYPAYSWGAVVAEVDVDVDTLVVTPRRLWLAYEIGRAINPLAARGQLEGGSLQALGWALSERLTIREGRYQEDRLQTYILPTSADIPRMELSIIEIPYPEGPGGAKGLGELPMNAVAPALRNAVSHALGIAPASIPMSPEQLFTLTHPELQ